MEMAIRICLAVNPCTAAALCIGVITEVDAGVAVITGSVTTGTGASGVTSGVVAELESVVACGCLSITVRD